MKSPLWENLLIEAISWIIAALVVVTFATWCGCAPPPQPQDTSCCHCLVEIDCLQGSPTEAQCEEHIDDPHWLPVALVPWEQDCAVDGDACGSWCTQTKGSR